MNEKKEIWRTYPEFDFIQGSNFGRVRTLDRYVKTKNGMRFIKGRILTQQRRKNGYMQVHFCVNGKQIIRLIHRIVAKTFLPNPNSLPQINHKDCDRANNNVNNLEWCDGSYNSKYREEHGKSSRQPMFAIDSVTLEMSRFRSQHEASQALGVCVGNINKVIKGERETAGGYWFTNADNTAVESTRAKFGNDIANKVEELLKKK